MGARAGGLRHLTAAAVCGFSHKSITDQWRGCRREPWRGRFGAGGRLWRGVGGRGPSVAGRVCKSLLYKGLQGDNSGGEKGRDREGREP